MKRIVALLLVGVLAITAGCSGVLSDTPVQGTPETAENNSAKQPEGHPTPSAPGYEFTAEDFQNHRQMVNESEPYTVRKFSYRRYNESDVVMENSSMRYNPQTGLFNGTNIRRGTKYLIWKNDTSSYYYNYRAYRLGELSPAEEESYYAINHNMNLNEDIIENYNFSYIGKGQTDYAPEGNQSLWHYRATNADLVDNDGPRFAKPTVPHALTIAVNEEGRIEYTRTYIDVGTFVDVEAFYVTEKGTPPKMPGES